MKFKELLFYLGMSGAFIGTTLTNRFIKQLRLCDDTKTTVSTKAYETYTDYNPCNLPGYNKIVVEHAEELSIEEIEALKGYEEVELVFDVTRLLKDNQRRLDVSSLSGTNITINYDSFSWMPDEVSKAILLVFLENEDETMFKKSFNYKKAKEVDYKLQEFSRNLDIKEFDSETRRLEKISRAVMEKITYDYDAATEKNAVKGKYYNRNSLSAILLGDGTREGVCDNYASLATILGYMNEVDLEYFSGFIRESSDKTYDVYHSWNAYVHDGTYDWLDYTLLDAYDEIYIELDESFDVSEYNTMIELIENYYKENYEARSRYYDKLKYDHQNNEDALTPTEEKQSVIHKKDLSGDLKSYTDVNREKLVFIIASLISLGIAISGVYAMKKGVEGVIKSQTSK